MASITFDRVSLQYPGAESPSVKDLSLHIDDAEFLVLVGPSGCGKSTTLRMHAGLEQVTEGSILIDDVDITEKDPKDRDIAMVFQNYALYPHMTVEQNMGFALKLAKTPKDEIRRRVEEAAEMLDLTEFLDRKPKALSGGQRQRVAMGRAIVRSPQVFCMDEPLSNLDAKLRVQTRSHIASLQRRLGVTTVYVTHDQVEAMTMGDRVAVLDKGELQQVASPRELYNSPANVFVAGFVGSPAMNLIETEADAEGRVLLGSRVIPTDARIQPRQQVTVGVRPEHLAVTEGEDGVDMIIDMVEELGSDSYVYGSADLPGSPLVVARFGGGMSPHKGDRVRLGAQDGAFHLFDTATGERIGG